jgi:ferrochelatase
MCPFDAMINTFYLPGKQNDYWYNQGNLLGKNMSSQKSVIGVLLTNTGSPDAPNWSAVRRYLKEFLSDRRVIDYPRWLWLPILYGIILNVRPARSARLYQKIWTKQGSPLLITSKEIAAKLERNLTERLGRDVQALVGMCYGNPSIAAQIKRLLAQGVSELVVLPLFPQYSVTTTTASLDAVFAALKTHAYIPPLKTLTRYHDHPAYINALVEQVKSFWAEKGSTERLMFSFHGIPERYRQLDCYAEQCHKTAQLVAEGLGIPPEGWAVAFQSRFGPEEWIKPYTHQTLEKWAAQGIRCVSVVAPGFATDCLETIDELGREARDIFLKAGGENHHSMIPICTLRR